MGKENVRQSYFSRTTLRGRWKRPPCERSFSPLAFLRQADLLRCGPVCILLYTLFVGLPVWKWHTIRVWSLMQFRLRTQLKIWLLCTYMTVVILLLYRFPASTLRKTRAKLVPTFKSVDSEGSC